MEGVAEGGGGKRETPSRILSSIFEIYINGRERQRQTETEREVE